MRYLISLFVVALLSVSWSVTAIENTVDEDSMQEMDDRIKSMTSRLSLADASGALEDARALEEMFKSVEAFYAVKNDAQDALEWSKQSVELTAVISQHLASNDFDHATQSAVRLSKTCKSCHQVYKHKD